MELINLIKILESAPQDIVIPKGFGYPHSWRGIYAELSFEPRDNVSIAEMLADARSAIGATYEGWKGGDFTMREDTEVHVAERGTSGDELGEILYGIGLAVGSNARANEVSTQSTN